MYVCQMCAIDEFHFYLEIMKKILICVRTILEIVGENQAYLVRQDVGKRQQSQSSTQNFEYLIKKPATTVDEMKGIDQKLEEEGAKNAAVSSCYIYQTH